MTGWWSTSGAGRDTARHALRGDPGVGHREGSRRAAVAGAIGGHARAARPGRRRGRRRRPRRAGSRARSPVPDRARRRTRPAARGRRLPSRRRGRGTTSRGRTPDARGDHATLAPLQLPSLSIVTPCLDAAATIEETIASLRAQDYPHLEHVVVDGGSTDGTLEILDRLGVRYVSEPDRGRAHAANKGVGLTSGDDRRLAERRRRLRAGGAAGRRRGVRAQPGGELGHGVLPDRRRRRGRDPPRRHRATRTGSCATTPSRST